MKKSKKKLAVLFLAAAMGIVMAGCGTKESGAPAAPAETTAETTAPAETTVDAKTTESSETAAEAKTDAAASAAEGPLALNYGAEPEAYVGDWVLVNAYAADNGMLKVEPDACFMKIETSIDTNKLVDEAAYIHADATNLKGTMSFKHAGIDVEPYSCSGNWSDWTVVDVVGENEAHFKGAIKFKIRDDDNGVFFDTLTGVKIEDMELFNVLGMNADGQLICGYSDDHIERDGSATWDYAYIFDKAK